MLADWDALDAVVRALGVQPSKVASLLIPAVACAAAAQPGAAALAAILDAVGTRVHRPTTVK